MHDEEFKRAIEAIKLRTPIEDVVRERVPDLKKTGALWVARCPFHDERTPSFKVDPRKGFWRCFGACATGGDQISFVQRFDRVPFIDALEILAARAGVELPRRGGRGEDGRTERLLAALEWAGGVFSRELLSSSGTAARNYLERRGLQSETLLAFGIGFAPASGEALLRRAAREGHGLDVLIEVGLARSKPGGSPYDFFRNRLIFPIRDERGRTRGFGARRLDDSDPKNPKYVNTPETPVFRKGELVFGLDRSLDEVRRSGHLILVEGYTDVMAAHQVGLRNTAAVLGTATTEDHAHRIRRTGARKITLIFDGDVAGRRATERALHGLLPLSVEIDVVAPPTGRDPCDLLLEQGPSWLAAELEKAPEWFEDQLHHLSPLSGNARHDGVDRLLELVSRISHPIERDERLGGMARVLEHPVESLREAFEQLPSRRRALRKARELERAEAGQRSAGSSSQGSSPGSGANGATTPEGSVETSGATRDDAPARDPARRRGLRRAFGEIAGAALVDTSLVPLIRPRVADCPEEDIARILAVILELHGSGTTVNPGAVMTALGEDPAREAVVPIYDHASRAEDPHALLEGAVRFLREAETEEQTREVLQGLADGGDDEAVRARLRELHDRMRAVKIP